MKAFIKEESVGWKAGGRRLSAFPALEVSVKLIIDAFVIVVERAAFV